MALSNITIGDGQSTPVNRTFEVFTPQVGINSALLLQKAGGITKLNERMELSMRRSGSGTAYRLDAVVKLPRVVDSVTQVSQTAIIECKVIIPDGFTQTQRDDIAAYLKNLMSHATIQSAVKQVNSFA